jgi:hypothetical protein
MTYTYEELERMHYINGDTVKATLYANLIDKAEEVKMLEAEIEEQY